MLDSQLSEQSDTYDTLESATHDAERGVQRDRTRDGAEASSAQSIAAAAAARDRSQMTLDGYMSPQCCEDDCLAAKTVAAAAAAARDRNQVTSDGYTSPHCNADDALQGDMDGDYLRPSCH